MTWKQAPVKCSKGPSRRPLEGVALREKLEPRHATGYEQPERRSRRPAVGPPSCVAFSGVMRELGYDAGSGPALTRLVQAW